MRWKEPELYHGATRVVNKFLFFPYTLHIKDTNEIETRWLEWAKIKQEYLILNEYKWWHDTSWEND
jgi:hypothetical protein